MVQDSAVDNAKRLMAEKLDNGLCIAVFGWHNRNHDQFTRSLDGNQFLFLETPPRIIPARVGYAITTRFITHSDRQSVRKRVPTLSQVLSTGHIKRILREIAAGQKPKKPEHAPQVRAEAPQLTAQSAPKEEIHMVSSTPPAAVQNLPSAAPVTAAGREEASVPELSSEERERRFAIDFMKQVGGDAGRTLSKYEASHILEKHFGEGRKNPSAHKKLLTGVVSEGNTKVGSYRATEYLLKLSGQSPEVEPDDPIEKARWLIARIPALLQRRDELEGEKARFLENLEREKAEFLARHGNEVGDVSNTLARCQKAKEMLDGLKKL